MLDDWDSSGINVSLIRGRLLKWGYGSCIREESISSVDVSFYLQHSKCSNRSPKSNSESLSASASKHRQLGTAPKDRLGRLGTGTSQPSLTWRPCSQVHPPSTRTCRSGTCQPLGTCGLCSLVPPLLTRTCHSGTCQPLGTCGVCSKVPLRSNIVCVELPG